MHQETSGSLRHCLQPRLRLLLLLATTVAAAACAEERAGTATARYPQSSSDEAYMTSFDVWRQREPIYELYVRHFSPEGTFKGVEARLPELKEMGIGIVWLLPVNEIGSKVPANGGEAIDAPHGNPYAVKSYERLNPEYGSDGTEASAEADLRDLVDRAHELDMRVILDWVPNHTAWDSELMAAHPEWYVRDGNQVRPVGEQFRWIAQLDWSNPELRAYMKGVMVDWVERFRLDGFRIDFAHHMPIEFFAELRTALEEVRPVFLLAEAGHRAFHPVFDMTYDWSVYPRLGDIAHGHRTVAAIDDALYYEQFLPYLDEPGALHMRMTYNHDDNGNWTLAERYAGGIKAFAVLASTLPGKPMIFDGQEVGMRVRTAGGPVMHGAPLTHDPAVKLDWEDPDGYRPFYTKLLQLHRANPALHQVGFQDFRKIDTNVADRVYAFVRRHGQDSVLVVVNLSPFDLPQVRLLPSANAGSIDGTYEELFSGQSSTLAAGEALHLAPWAYRVYVRGPLALGDTRLEPWYGSDWERVVACENDDLSVYARSFDPGQYRFKVRPQAANDHLELGPFSVGGMGAPLGPAGFVGLAAGGGSHRAIHVFPEYGGIKVVLDVKAHYYCSYQPLYGDSSGQVQQFAVLSGEPCPARPHYQLLGSSPGVDHAYSKNWFFQNCRNIGD